MTTSKTAARRVLSAQREAECARRKIAGQSYRTMAADLGITPEAARKAVIRAHKRWLQTAETDIAEVVAVEIQRLDAMLLALWKGAAGGREPSIDRVLRIMERRAKLLGLDATAPGGAMRISSDGNGTTIIEIQMPQNER